MKGWKRFPRFKISLFVALFQILIGISETNKMIWAELFSLAQLNTRTINEVLLPMRMVDNSTEMLYWIDFVWQLHGTNKTPTNYIQRGQNWKPLSHECTHNLVGCMAQYTFDESSFFRLYSFRQVHRCI